MKIKKVRKQMVTKFWWSTKISKSYILLLFFFIWAYSLYIINYFTVSFCSVPALTASKSLLIEQIRTYITYPIFLICLFCFMVQSSRAINKEWGSNDDHLPPVTMAVTIIYFKGLWLDFVQFLCQIKNNSTDRKKEWSLNFQKNQNLKILLLCNAQHYII